jgi:putative transposase
LYNEERPHQALGNDTPAEHYQASPRRFDGILREPDYGGDYTVRRVRTSGEIKWQGNTIYISAALTGEPIGLIEDADGDWLVCYGPIELGVIAHGGDRLRKPKRHACGLVGNAKERCPQGPQDRQPQQQS